MIRVYARIDDRDHAGAGRLRIRGTCIEQADDAGGGLIDVAIWNGSPVIRDRRIVRERGRNGVSGICCLGQEVRFDIEHSTEGR